MSDPIISHSEITDEIYIVCGTKKYNVTEQVIRAMRETGRLEQQRPHGEWVSKPKRVQVDETDEKRIFETKLEWFCSSCGKSFGCRKPEDAFCKYCGSDNRPRILDEASDGEGKDGNVREGEAEC